MTSGTRPSSPPCWVTWAASPKPPNPGTAFPLSERITAALTAYGCGDALGLPWEQKARPATAEEIEALPPRQGWPGGATSDDTALTMLVAGYLAEHGDDADALTLLGQIAGQVPQIRGLGPSTQRAIEHFQSAGELPQEDGATNGAAMRALPAGWAAPPDEAERRRGLAIELSRATHPSAQAQCAACVIAACGSWTIEGASARLIVEVAAGEAAEAARICGAEPGLEPMLDAVAAGTWQAPADGVSLDPYQTIAAVLSCGPPACATPWWKRSAWAVTPTRSPLSSVALPARAPHRIR